MLRNAQRLFENFMVVLRIYEFCVYFLILTSSVLKYLGFNNISRSENEMHIDVS